MSDRGEVYNMSLLQRQHDVYVGDLHEVADTMYVRVVSACVGELSLQLRVYKSVLNFRRPSHLVVELTVAPSILLDPMHCYFFAEMSYAPRFQGVRFTFHDHVAFSHVMRRLDPKYSWIEDIVVGFFRDWVEIDARKRRRAARVIRQRARQKMYAPNSAFVVTQARHTWA